MNTLLQLLTEEVNGYPAWAAVVGKVWSLGMEG